MLGIPTLHAADGHDLPKAKQTKLGLYLTPQEAFDKVSAEADKVLFLDVRTPAEVIYVGMPSAADANIPYMVQPDFPVWDETRSTFKLEPNPDFVSDVRVRLERKGLKPDAEVIVMCRSGDRSAAAANILAEAGFTKVYSIPEGFEGDMAKDGPNAGTRSVNGWKNAKLPWTYRLDRQKMYGLQ
ncbi:rhodanese-like domain-containing protein [Mesorhizobium sp. 1M-11]|uniref:rhodanese-like domain-containing protein n=1 Tax=Mesorhizobium sp. 1M-11 TaxID=1529006 RepID=UPI001FCDC45D|nr:rhodanese-like domain-containing protein [Mesorhizobium sp. 1M-11]